MIWTAYVRNTVTHLESLGGQYAEQPLNDKQFSRFVAAVEKRLCLRDGALRFKQIPGAEVVRAVRRHGVNLQAAHSLGYKYAALQNLERRLEAAIRYVKRHWSFYKEAA